MRLYRMLETIDSCPAPVVCCVHGFALGGGSGLVACADIAVAWPDAVFGFTEVRLGIIPAVISPFVLAQDRQRRAPLLRHGRALRRRTWRSRIGLVSEVSEDARRAGRADRARASSLAARSRCARRRSSCASGRPVSNGPHRGCAPHERGGAGRPAGASSTGAHPAGSTSPRPGASRRCTLGGHAYLECAACRSGDCSSRIAERSRCASSARVASSASRRSPSWRRTTRARSTPARPTSASRSRRTCTRRSTSAPRRQSGRGRDPSRLRLPRRERRLRRSGRGRRV